MNSIRRFAFSSFNRKDVVNLPEEEFVPIVNDEYIDNDIAFGETSSSEVGINSIHLPENSFIISEEELEQKIKEAYERGVSETEHKIEKVHTELNDRITNLSSGIEEKIMCIIEMIEKKNLSHIKEIKDIFLLTINKICKKHINTNLYLENMICEMIKELSNISFLQIRVADTNFKYIDSLVRKKIYSKIDISVERDDSLTEHDVIIDYKDGMLVSKFDDRIEQINKIIENFLK